MTICVVLRRFFSGTQTLGDFCNLSICIDWSNACIFWSTHNSLLSTQISDNYSPLIINLYRFLLILHYCYFNFVFLSDLNPLKMIPSLSSKNCLVHQAHKFSIAFLLGGTVSHLIFAGSHLRMTKKANFNPFLETTSILFPSLVIAHPHLNLFKQIFTNLIRRLWFLFMLVKTMLMFLPPYYNPLKSMRFTLLWV